MFYRLCLVLCLFLTACGEVSVVPGVSDRVDAARERNDGPAIWRVTDFDSTLYLYGTVH